MSHFQRTLPQTFHYLQSQMDSIPFPYLNKLGHNSRPNAYALLLGIPAAHLSEDTYEMVSRLDELCKTAMDNKTIITDFTKNGYRTLYYEDWAAAALNWPHCTGFTTNQLDHFMKPFVARYYTSSYADEELNANLLKKACLSEYEYVLRVLQEYLGKYSGKPKFSLSWISSAAHNRANHLFAADDRFRDFFESNKEKLSNSFIFFASDHGNNVDKLASSSMGRLERQNPFLVVILPEKLRKNVDLRELLSKNSKQLVTHYDLYATFLEIAENSYQWNKYTNFSQTEYKPSDRKLIGSSILHPLKQPRNCKSLRIPFIYCMCKDDSKNAKNETVLLEIAELSVTAINEVVSNSEFRDKCVKLKVDRSETAKLSLRIVDPKEGEEMFKGEFKVLPSGGYYEALAKYQNGTLTLVSKTFPRLDRYADQTKCMPDHFIRNYCYCNDL